MNLHWVETCLLKPCHSHLKFLQEQIAACLILILPLPAEINVQQTWDTLLRPSGHITLHCWSRDPSGRYWFLDSSLVGRWCLEPQSFAGGQGAKSFKSAARRPPALCFPEVEGQVTGDVMVRLVVAQAAALCTFMYFLFLKFVPEKNRETPSAGCEC